MPTVDVIEVNDQFVDVDFQKDPNFVFGDLGTCCMGSLADDYTKVTDIIPRNTWEGICEKRIAEGHKGLPSLVVEIKNQKSEGSCVGNAATQQLQIIQAIVMGKENVILLSAISLYDRIGRSANSGAMVSDALEEVRERGIVPLNTPENQAKFKVTMPATGFSRSMPSGWEEVAAKFKGVEYYTINSTEALITALLNGHPVVVGRQGHSICYVGVVFKNGRMYVLYVNSWGEWGQAAGDFEYGFGLDTESQIRQSSSWAYAIRTGTFDPGVLAL